MKYHFVFKRFLGRGSFGAVCLYQNRKDNKFYAIKFEELTQNSSTITSEALILKKLMAQTPDGSQNSYGNVTDQESTLFPKYYEHGLSDLTP